MRKTTSLPFFLLPQSLTSHVFSAFVCYSSASWNANFRSCIFSFGLVSIIAKFGVIYLRFCHTTSTTLMHNTCYAIPWNTNTKTNIDTNTNTYIHDSVTPPPELWSTIHVMQPQEFKILKDLIWFLSNENTNFNVDKYKHKYLQFSHHLHNPDPQYL